ncbi:hypothetical protein Rsub_02286 [Raphidocelis subcapitata]|uniref:Uncharacterized protein n=1 Tax=Raphidocelis subcapitata TaxID=307507 RepID=A0A2V0NPL7_9CHLO|nr:hypothetical protein Rsub_02286 [Raphidocelis subcapitata]|eukprot:GBF89568.1 hypothetical protein Rsub_02286 [Raphidocelis subcapitata]
MRPTLLFLVVAATLVVVVRGQDRRLLAQTSCSSGSGVKGNATSYSVAHESGNNGTICFKVAANAPCDKAQSCCLAAGDKHPKFKHLILTPPAGSTCAEKELRKLVKWTVAGGKPKRAIADGSVIKVKIAKLDPVNGGLVCVDLAASGSDGCKTFENLCKGGKCDMQLLTKKFKKAKGSKRVDCCSAVAAGGNTTIIPSLCLNVTCPAPTECESAGGICDETTGLCGAPTIKPNGTTCSTGTCQGGVCTGLVAYADCSQNDTDSLPCFVAASASSGLCMNSTCVVGTSTLSNLLAPEFIGLVEDLVAIDGNTTGDGAKAVVTFNTPINAPGRLLLAAPYGFTRAELTLPDGSNVTVDYSEFEGSAFVSDDSGQEFRITAPQNGSTLVEVLYYSPATGLVSFFIDLQDYNMSQLALQNGHGRRLLGPWFDACLPEAADAFCDYFSIATYSAAAAVALSSAVRNYVMSACLVITLETGGAAAGACGFVMTALSIVTAGCTVLTAGKRAGLPICPPTPPPPPVVCESATYADGEQGFWSYAAKVGYGNTVQFTYDAYYVFDTATGKKLFDIKAGDPGGCIPVDTTGYGQVTLTKPYTSSELQIDVSAPCEGTAWEFTMACAAGSAPSLRLPQESTFRERGVQYEEDYKKSIGEGGGGE